MGIFDYIRCDLPLPETPVPPPWGTFQTKDTPDQYMTLYTITAEGRLSWRPYRMVEVPPEERPHYDKGGIWELYGSLRREEEDPETLEDFHGDVQFYAFQNGGWWEYRARFTDGFCGGIDLIEFQTPEAVE